MSALLACALKSKWAIDQCKGRWQTGFRGFWAEGDKRKAERALFSD